MKGASPANNNLESPKTPGGISKSLLTPCRRVGLSRKWKRGGCSPFVSPLSSQNPTPESNENSGAKKRKKCDDIQNLRKNETPRKQLNDTEESNITTPETCNNLDKNVNITTTPSRNTQLPRKKSKTLALSLKSSQENKEPEVPISSNKILQEESHTSEKDVILERADSESVCKTIENKNNLEENISKPVKQKSEKVVSKPVRSESKGKIRLSLKKSLSKSDCDTEQKLSNHSSENTKPKEKSPNNLTKECIVVIQNKIFKSDNERTQSITEKVSQETANKMKEDIIEKVSQESDMECDIPLSLLKKNSNEDVTLNLLDDTDFITRPSKESQSKKKIRNLSIIKSRKGQCNDSNNASQTSQDANNRTILVKKSYEKVTKPLKAKSTGSITQKDIDDIWARIEMKKKLLMAKAMSIDTEELRRLIKKWQKGCQEALMELLELMKKKLPDRQDMDYAEILETLKIPPDLVGYDSENDCFVTPDDTNVLLSTFKL